MNYCVITICLNSSSTIENTINSVFLQSILPKKYIFVDGGSTDCTLDIIQSFSERFVEYGIQLIVLKQIHFPFNAGIPESWNQALLEVDTDVVFILNSDDWYDDDHTSYKVLKILEDPSIHCVAGSTKLFNSSNQLLSCHNSKSQSLFPVLNPINHPAFFAKKSVYEVVGHFDCSFRVSADYDFMFRVYKSDFNIFVDNEISVSRYDGGFAFNNQELAAFETFIISLKNHRKLLIPFCSYFIRICKVKFLRFFLIFIRS